VWSVKVSTHSALEKSQIFTVPSPDDVARRAPLWSTYNDGLSWLIKNISFLTSNYRSPLVTNKIAHWRTCATVFLKIQVTPILHRRLKFKNATLFQSESYLPHYIRHEFGALRKRSSNRRNLKTAAFRFRVDGNHFWQRSFSKTSR